MIAARSAWTDPPATLALASAAALALLAGPWPLNLYLVGGVAAFLLAFYAPAAALGALVASVPVQAVGSMTLGPTDLTVTKTLLAAIVTAWLLRLAISRRTPRLDWTACFLALYVLVLMASIANAGDTGAWAEEVYRWASALAVYVIAREVMHDGGSVRPALLGMAAGTIGASALGFYQVAVGSGPASFNVGGSTRAFATFGEPNPFAGYLELTVPVLLAASGAAVLGVARSRRTSISVVAFCALAAVLGVMALGLTQSRGGWIGAAVGVGIVVWLIGGWVRWTALAVAVAGVGLAAATPIGARIVARAGDGIVPRPGAVQVTTANFAMQERLAHWRAGIEMVRRSPLLGVGAGNFTANFRDATRVWRFRISRGHAHNAYIQAAAQSGLIGLAAYVTFVAAVAGKLIGALRRGGGAPPLAIGATGVCAALAVHNVFDYLHVLSLGVQLSVVLALIEVSRETTTA